MSLVNYSIPYGNAVDVIENSCTLNSLASDPIINTTTLWIDTATSHLNRAVVDIEDQVISSTYVPTFTPLEGTPNTYTNVTSMYTRNGPFIFVWSSFNCLANATQVASVNVSLPYPTSGAGLNVSGNLVYTTNFITDSDGTPSGTTLLQTTLASNTSFVLSVKTNASLTSGQSKKFTLIFLYLGSLI